MYILLYIYIYVSVGVGVLMWGGETLCAPYRVAQMIDFRSALNSDIVALS